MATAFAIILAILVYVFVGLVAGRYFYLKIYPLKATHLFQEEPVAMMFGMFWVFTIPFLSMWKIVKRVEGLYN